jgi:hypothetical protein
MRPARSGGGGSPPRYRLGDRWRVARGVPGAKEDEAMTVVCGEPGEVIV